MKKDTEGILSLICDLFEYSEEERTAMLQPKTRKFFGILWYYLSCSVKVWVSGWMLDVGVWWL